MNEDLEDFLEKKKSELRKMKDTDFVSMPVKVSGPMKRVVEGSIDSLSDKHQMDVMEIESGMMSYGIDALERLIQNKGLEYAKNLIKEIIDASDKGDFEKMQKLLGQMRKDTNEDNYIRKNDIGKDISFEQFVKENEEKLTKEYESYKEEDFMIIKARNPENQEDIIELDLHKSQVAEIREEAANIGIPFEEFAFIIIKKTLERSEGTPPEEKKKIREFLNRQIKRIEDKAKDDLQDSLEKISLGQIKEKLIELYSIPRKKLDKFERSWKKEFKEKELSSQYRNEEMYCKIKFASMLKRK